MKVNMQDDLKQTISLSDFQKNSQQNDSGTEAVFTSSEDPAGTGLDSQKSASGSGRAILLSSYGTGANKGKNLGVPGYSHDIVMQLYVPLLRQWGTVITVDDPHAHLETAIDEARSNGLLPIHLSVIPCQDAYLSERAPNVLMPAWEFPDIPDHPFGGKEQNDWTLVSNAASALLVSGPFTLDAFRRADVTTPIHFVQVPTPEDYFRIPLWEGSETTSINCKGYSFPFGETTEDEAEITTEVGCQKDVVSTVTMGGYARKKLRRVGKKTEKFVRQSSRRMIGRKYYRSISKRIRRARGGGDFLPEARFDELDLSGVVYSSIFNPNDGRKNWTDLLTSFLYALGDKPDATLVIKLVTRDPKSVERVLRYYRRREIEHLCRVVFISDYLTESQLHQLTQASTYYLQTTRAEGNCLPLMNYLSAGRPGISPCHSAIGDYFDEQVGFVAQSHQEPAAWPHDPRLRMRSTWARLVWPSMVEKIRASYDVAKNQPTQYQQLSQNARERMRTWAGTRSVGEKLHKALDAVHTAHYKNQSTTLNLMESTEEQSSSAEPQRLSGAA